MDPFSVPHILLSAVALAATGVFCAVPVLRWNLNHDAFMGALVGLMEKGQLARAYKLTQAAPHAMIVAVAQPAVGRAWQPPAPSLDELAALTAQGLADAASRLRQWALVGVASLLLLGLSAAVGAVVQAPLATPGWAMSGIATVLLLVGFRTLHGLREAVAATPVELLIPLVAALGQDPPAAEAVVAAVEASSGPESTASQDLNQVDP